MLSVDYINNNMFSINDIKFAINCLMSNNIKLNLQQLSYEDTIYLINKLILNNKLLIIKNNEIKIGIVVLFTEGLIKTLGVAIDTNYTEDINKILDIIYTKLGGILICKVPKDFIVLTSHNNLTIVEKDIYNILKYEVKRV